MDVLLVKQGGTLFIYCWGYKFPILALLIILTATYQVYFLSCIYLKLLLISWSMGQGLGEQPIKTHSSGCVVLLHFFQPAG